MNDVLKTDNYPRNDLDWDDIEDLIKRWAKKHPQKMADNREWVQKARESARDPKYGEWKGGGTRLSILIHPELLNFIETMYPKFMKDNAHVTKFKKKFKAFTVPQKI